MAKPRLARLLPALIFLVLALLALVLAFTGYRPGRHVVAPTLIPHPQTPADRIVNRAKMEVQRGVRYDPAYCQLDYPGGDVPADRGACTDVVVRALRAAGYDLQRLIHEDMARHFDLYPHKWGLSRPDANIDHRRVPNHLVFLRRHGRSLPLETTGRAAATWQAGDLVYWRITPTQLTHCGVVSDERGAGGLPLVIHNIGPVATQEDCLTRWKIIGHFRYPGSWQGRKAR